MNQLRWSPHPEDECEVAEPDYRIDLFDCELWCANKSLGTHAGLEQAKEAAQRHYAARSADHLRKALEYYADPEHWRTKNASSSLGNVGYGLGYHRTNPDGQMETLAAHCGHWVASKQMVHGGHWQADAGHVARQALRQAPEPAGGEQKIVAYEIWKDGKPDSHALTYQDLTVADCADGYEARPLVYAAAPTQEDGRGAAAAFGHGTLIVDTGTAHGQPAVFIRPSPEPGPVGEKITPEHEGPLDRLVPGEIFMTFPTDEQAQRVADALCNAPHTSGEVTEALHDVFQRWLDGYGFNEDSDEDVALSERVHAALQGDKA